jgi:predicted DNA-binding transcriptional regulator YafY
MTMRRTDRLFDLISTLSDNALHRAEDLATAHNVALRTIYRDIARLQTAGLPVTGARGAGYCLTPAITLPPLTLSENEIEALQLGLAIVLQSADPDLRSHAETLTAKIDAALPETNLHEASKWDMIPNPFSDAARGLAHLPTLRATIKARQKLHLLYNAADAQMQQHVVQPQTLTHHARSWVLTAYSENSLENEAFRLDLIEDATALPELF